MASSKSDLLNLRIEPELMVAATGIRAEHQLADRVGFSVTPAQWQALVDALDRPPRDIPRLQRLMQEPSALEQK